MGSEEDMKLADDIRRFSLFILFPVLLSTSGIAQDNPASAAAQEIIAVARDRADSLTKNECDKWASYGTYDFQDIGPLGTESREVLLSGCRHAAHSKSECKSERTLSDFHFQFVGNFAFMYYEYATTERCGDFLPGLTPTARSIHTKKEMAGGSPSMPSKIQANPQDPPVAKIDPAILDDYTGQYAWIGAHMLDTVTRKGDKLYIQTTGDDTPTELVPQSTDTFFIRGGLARDTFVRDASGKVVENRGYGADTGPTAAAYRAKKIK